MDCSLCRHCPWCWCTGCHCGRWATEFQVGSEGPGCGRKCCVAQRRPPGKNSGQECRSPPCFSPERGQKSSVWPQKDKTKKRINSETFNILKDFYPRKQMFAQSERNRLNKDLKDKIFACGNKLTRLVSSPGESAVVTRWTYMIPEIIFLFTLVLMWPSKLDMFSQRGSSGTWACCRTRRVTRTSDHRKNTQP